MTKSRVFFIILISFIVGVFIRSFFEINQNIFFLLIILAICLAGIFYKNKKILIASLVILFLVFGAWQTDGAIKKTQNLSYENVSFQEKAIVQKVSPNSFGQNLIIELQNEKFSLLAQVPQYPEYSYGDELEISCTAKSIENKDAEFDYQMYMAKDGVLYQCMKPKIQKIELL